jgi:uncharacterized protein
MRNQNVRAMDNGPWYREPWPWIIMTGPFIVIVAGVATAWLAIKSNDGLVTEDYYKKGLAINQTVEQSASAESLGLSAAIKVDSDRINIKMAARDPSFKSPPAINVTVLHPTRAGLDQSRTMALIEGSYSAAFQLPSAGHWLVVVSDDAKAWRLMGNVVLPSQSDIILGDQGQSDRQQKE